MHLKKVLATGVATLWLMGSVMNVSATELSSNDYINTLLKNHQESLIIDVDAYKAAYPDLAQAFGDDSDAYVKHYLTMGVYEGRTKGILFDPLVYVEAYGDVRQACGYDISEIVKHYVAFGIKENRTQGTASGYADIAAAEEAGVQNTKIQRNTGNISAYNSNAAVNTNINSGSNNKGGDNSSFAVNPASNVNDNFGSNNTGSDNSSFAANYASNNHSDSDSNDTGSDGSSSAANPASGNSSNPVVNNTDSSAATSAPVDTGYSFDYNRTTTIYKDDGDLWRVEYYDENDKLTHYSDVTNYDGSTNSYTENIYHFDEETNTSVLDRSDTYENGSLVSSSSQ